MRSHEANQRREEDFKKLKSGLTDCWRGQEQLDVVKAVAQEYVGWPLPEQLSVAELVEQLERTGIVSPNAVDVLKTMSEVSGCERSARLVSEYQDKHPPVAARTGPGPPRSTRSSSSAEQRVWGESSGKQQVWGEPSGKQQVWGESFAKQGAYDEVLVMSDASSSTMDDFRTAKRYSSTPGSASSMLPPLESMYMYSAETEEDRHRSRALWGHGGGGVPEPSAAVCECSPTEPAPRWPSSSPRRSSQSSRHISPVPRYSSPPRRNTVEHVLQMHPTPSSSSTHFTTAASTSTFGGCEVTPAGERRARLVDFLSRRLGPRYAELGGQMEVISPGELATITTDTRSDLVSRSRRLLQLYLCRHRAEDGDLEEALVRRLRRIRFNRLADELQRWSGEQDQDEDPRDWDEDKRRWKHEQGLLTQRHAQRHEHPSPVRIPHRHLPCC